MTWDTTTPTGSESISNGDNRIRELKTDLQTALRGNATDGDEAKFPGSDTANPIFRYRGLKGTTGARPTAGQYGLYFNTTLNALQRDNGSSWDTVGTVIPSGTVMLFFQASAPVGWTQVTTQNDKTLRIVSSTGGGTGGTNAMSTGLSHTHTISSDGGHTHSSPITTGTPSSTNDYTAGSGNSLATSGHTHTVTIASDGAHTHTGATGSTAPTFQYIDVIACSKD